jgi:polysaccharide export outer membrane protein
MVSMQKILFSLTLLFSLLFSFSINPAIADEKNDYRIGAGDVLDISVFRSPDLKLQSRVSGQGNINFPLIGEVKVEGKTASEVEKDISKSMIDKALIKSPQVNVKILEYNSKLVIVLGNVAKPGSYPLEKNMQLMEVLALAGGITPNGSEVVSITSKKENATVTKSYDIRNIFNGGQEFINPQIQANDVVYVPNFPQFYVYGEVAKPGVYKIEQNLRVSQALALSGGLSPKGTTKGITIERVVGGKVNVVPASLNDFIQDKDVIYFKESVF